MHIDNPVMQEIIRTDSKYKSKEKHWSEKEESVEANGFFFLGCTIQLLGREEVGSDDKNGSRKRVIPMMEITVRWPTRGWKLLVRPRLSDGTRREMARPRC